MTLKRSWQGTDSCPIPPLSPLPSLYQLPLFWLKTQDSQTPIIPKSVSVVFCWFGFVFFTFKYFTGTLFSPYGSGAQPLWGWCEGRGVCPCWSRVQIQLGLWSVSYGAMGLCCAGGRRCGLVKILLRIIKRLLWHTSFTAKQIEYLLSLLLSGCWIRDFY